MIRIPLERISSVLLMTLALAITTPICSRVSAQTDLGPLESYSNEFGKRSYRVFIPKDLPAQSSLLVVLHGCLMTGEQMGNGTEFNKLAEAFGIAVLYPEQSNGDNPLRCWNWFKPENLKRNSGELSIITGMTETVIKKYNLDRKNVVVTGLSAGSALASSLIACHSDLFNGALLHSGLEYAAAKSENEAHDAMSTGPKHDLKTAAQKALACSPSRKKPIRIVVVHGSKDKVVNPVNGDRTAELFVKMNTAIFLKNGGQAKQIATINGQISQDSPKYSAETTDTVFDGHVTVRKIMVNGMDHAWSGGLATVPYMDPKGINASQILMDMFFQQK